MLPFAALRGPGLVDASPTLTAWQLATDAQGGVSQRAGRSWFGRANATGNGFAAIFLPFTAVAGGRYRLSFQASGDRISWGYYRGTSLIINPAGMSSPTTGATRVQYDFTTSFAGAARTLIRCDSATTRQADFILLEQLN
ncbi:hypothetical protein [Sphingomonas sp.]|uniref:hypothetical protein n=1 Tax=Sphingomonas sp. TaxID=28214 RepID=UPI003B00062D